MSNQKPNNQKPQPNAGGAGFIKLPTTKIKKPSK